MASFHAELHLAGTTYRVVRCHYSCSQPTDARGRVSAKVRHDLLHLTVDVPEDDALLDWAATPFKALAGEVVFYDATQYVAHETIAFTAGQCVGYRETFESGAGGDGAYVCQLMVAATAFELRSGGATAAAVVAAISGSNVAKKKTSAKKLSKSLLMGGGETTGELPEGTASGGAAAARTPKDIIKAVNPLQGTQNCTHIVEAIVSRWHGIDPEAVAPNEGLRMLEDVEKKYDVEFKPINNFYSVFNLINDSPEGTIAFVAMGPRVEGENPTGHIVAIVNHNGQATIMEAQNLGPYFPKEVITDPTRAIRRYGDEEETRLGYAIIPLPKRPAVT